MRNPPWRSTVGGGRVEASTSRSHDLDGEPGVGRALGVCSIGPSRARDGRRAALEATALGRDTGILVPWQQGAGSRVHDMRKLKAVQAYAGRGPHIETPAGCIEDEEVVAEAIVGDERRVVDELQKCRDGIGKQRRTLQIPCRDAGELLDLRQERALGSHERLKLAVHGSLDDPAGTDLDDLVIRRVGPVGIRLKVENHAIAADRERERSAIAAE